MKSIALHNTAVKNDGTKQLKGVNDYHKKKWNMKSSLGWYVGYNFFCDVDAKETNTRCIGEETIANKGHNCDVKSRCDTISYCMAFDGSQQFPTDKQNKTFQSFIRRMKKDYPNIKVVGHRDLQKSRTCPGKLITDTYISSFNKIETLQSLQEKLNNATKFLTSLLQAIKKMYTK